MIAGKPKPVLPPDRDGSELELVPLFPVDSFTPQSKCNHAKKPIPPGSPFICMVCHQSGLDTFHAPAKS